MLDEECLLPQSSEAAYVAKMNKHFEAVGCYGQPARTGGRGRPAVPSSSPGEEGFIIRHYAGEVLYSAALWIPKNKASLPPGVEMVLAASTLPLLASLFGAVGAGAKGAGAAASDGAAPRRGGGGGGGGASSTVLGRFRSSLKELFATLQQTSTRFVRCIKPNAAKAAGHFDGRFVERQLRCDATPHTVHRSPDGVMMRHALSIQCTSQRI